MPVPVAPWVPMALGSAVGSVAYRAGSNLVRWADSRYINPRPTGPSATTVMRRTTRRPTTRRYRRRRRRGIVRRRIPRALTSLTRIVRARAVGATTHPCTSGAINVTTVSMFDVTDPFVGAGSGQPLGYDQWKSLYNKGYVVGLKVTLRAHNTGTVAVMYGITPLPESQGASTLTPYNYYMELPGTKARILSPDVDHGVLVSKVSTRKHVHVKNLQDEDTFHFDLDNETAPTRGAYFHLWVQPIDASSTNSVQFVYTAEYLIRLFDPIVPARSTDT